MLPQLLLPARRARLVSCLGLLFVLGTFSPATAQLTMVETGFTVMDLGGSLGAKKIECSPGGIWGDYIYVADSFASLIERIDYSNVVTTFATFPGGSFPVGLAWGPGPGANFGNYMYVSNYGTSLIDRVDQFGTVTPFAAFPQPSSGTFDPSGAYGNELFVTTAYAGPIYKVDEFGVATPWATVPSLYIEFGPGGAWGTGMYATSETAVGIVKVDIVGVPTNFSTGFTNPEGFDWAYGTGFMGDMFACDVTAGNVWRVNSSGAKTLWATFPGAADLAFCNGALYLVGFHGGCYKVTPDEPVPATFRDVSAVAESNGVSIRWDVVADEVLDGFNVYRSVGNVGMRAMLDGNLLDATSREYVDTDVRAGETYRYVIAAVSKTGREYQSLMTSVTMPDTKLATRNYPNPFNPATVIEFTLPEAAPVELSIYDARGALVVTLENGTRGAGTHTNEWNGFDASGKSVASGTYFYRLTVGSESVTRKMTLLK